MRLIANNITHSYSNKILLNNINLTISKNNKIGLIGLNGSGKSTFLKILAGKQDSEYGEVTLIKNSKISFMEQEVDLLGFSSVSDFARSKIENGFVVEHELKAYLTKLNITNFNEKIENLSYGSKRKLILAATLAEKSDLLILDEPTNHLDHQNIEWLEKTLQNTTKAIIMVTHDRYFLENVCNVICELDRQELNYYEANYSKYLELKNQKEQASDASMKKLQSFLRREYKWIQRGPKARGTKDKRRIENYNELSNIKKDDPKKIFFESLKSRMGNNTIECLNVGHKYDSFLFRNFSLIFNKDDRIGIIGANSSGKTTLLKIISGEIEPFEGSVLIGSTIRISYFKQDNYDIDYNKRLIDYLNDIKPIIETEKGSIHPVALLERFMFDDPYLYIEKLSGGEKRRLYLLAELIKNPNVLILDEPTNDLDITTISILEEYLEDFKGIVLVVSHDRYFLDKVCNRLLVLEDSSIKIIDSSYYELKKVKKEKIKENIQPLKTKQTKLTFNEKRELETILNEINLLENKIKDLENQINNSYKDYEVSLSLQKDASFLKEKLDSKIKRWEYLTLKEEENL